MFWLLIGSLIGTTLCLLLHFQQHFRCKSCCKQKKSFIAPSTPLTPVQRVSKVFSRGQTPGDVLKQAARDSFAGFNKGKYQCCLQTAGDEKFDFYPFSFLLYLLYLCIITTLILIKYMWFENNWRLIVDDKVLLINIDIVIDDAMHIWYRRGVTLMDWIIIYNIVIMACWESLFNFYRYFTTTFTSKNMYSPSAFMVFKRFSIYVILFMALCIIQINFYWILFPLIIVIYFGYNVFCTHSFCTIFLEQYKELSNNLFGDVPDDMMKSIYFMRNTSITSCFISTISFSLLLTMNDIHILYYLPAFWAISAMTFTLNFVRNRQILYLSLFKIYQFIKHCKCKRLQFTMNLSPRNSSSSKIKQHQKNLDIIVNSDLEKHVQQQKTPHLSTQTTEGDISQLSLEDMDSNTHCNQLHLGLQAGTVSVSMNSSNSPWSTPRNSTNNPIITNAVKATLSPKTPPLKLSSVSSDIDNDNDNDINPPDIRKKLTIHSRRSNPSKALSILGVTRPKSPMSSNVHHSDPQTPSTLPEVNEMDDDDDDDDDEEEMVYVGDAYSMDIGTYNTNNNSHIKGYSAGDARIAIEFPAMTAEEDMNNSGTFSIVITSPGSVQLANIPSFQQRQLNSTQRGSSAPDHDADAEVIPAVPSTFAVPPITMNALSETDDNDSYLHQPKFHCRRSTSPMLPPVSPDGNHMHHGGGGKIKLAYAASVQSPVSRHTSTDELVQMDFRDSSTMATMQSYHLEDVMKTQQRAESDGVNVLRLLVDHGFYSRHSFNSFQQLRRFRKSTSADS